jgi:chaperonin GroES
MDGEGQHLYYGVQVAFKPLYDRVVVKRDDKLLITPAGLHRSEAHTQFSDKATVRYVGTGRLVDGVEVPLKVKVGDRVMIAPGAGVEIDVEGEKLILMMEPNIIGIL